MTDIFTSHCLYRPRRKPDCLKPTYPAKRYRSLQADLHHAEKQRRRAALLCGLMRTVTYPVVKIVGMRCDLATFQLFAERKTTHNEIKIPVTSLLVPDHITYDVPEMIRYCDDEGIAFEIMPWAKGKQRVTIILLRNAADQTLLKLVFPELR